MNTQEFIEKRHTDLWLEESKRVGRLIFGIGVFAVLACVKVVHPFTDLSKKEQIIAAKEERARLTLQRSEEDLEALQTELRTHTDTLKVLGYATSVLREAPWKEDTEKLKETFSHWSEDYRILNSLSTEKLRALLESIKEPSIETESRMQLQGQLPPREMESSVQQQGQFAQLSQSQEAIPERERSIEIAPEQRAIISLRIDPDMLRRATASGDVKNTLNEHTMALFEEEAGDTVHRIARKIRNQVLAPMMEQLQTIPVSGSVSNAVEEMQGKLEEWAAKTFEDADWWMTVEGKDAVTAEITDSLKQSLSPLQSALEEEQRQLKETIGTVESSIGQTTKVKNEAEAERQRYAELQQDLEKKMNELLPAWLRGLIPIETLFQAFPLAILGLVSLVAFKLGQVRRHFRFIADAKQMNNEALADTAISTLWTLAWRGIRGTSATWLVLSGLIVAAAIVFDVSVRDLQSGLSSLQADERWLREGQLTILRWLGFIAFISLLIAIPAILWRDRKRNP